jgi:sec-independent protein translocase protein TatB
MFDIGMEKFLLIAVAVGLIAGPERLVSWMRTLSTYARRFRDAFREGKSQVTGELDRAAPDWRSLDPRRVDPRRIIRDALTADLSSPVPPRAHPTEDASSGLATPLAAEGDPPAPHPSASEQTRDKAS